MIMYIYTYLISLAFTQKNSGPMISEGNQNFDIDCVIAFNCKSYIYEIIFIEYIEIYLVKNS